MKLDAKEIRKEIEGEVYEHLHIVNYGGDKLLESIENVANMVLLEYGIKESYIEVRFATGGNIKIEGVKKTVEEWKSKKDGK